MNRWTAVLAGLLPLCGIALLGAVETDQRWQLRPSNTPGQVHFSIERTHSNGRWSHSSDVPLSRFRGLSIGALSGRGPARFEYVSDAGRLLCEGTFHGNGGSGQFTFAADPRFGSELQRLGYTPPATQDLLSMLLADVTLDFARKVKESGIAAGTRELLEMRIHGITNEYLDGMRTSGYPGLSARDYIEMRIHGVTPELTRELKDAGYTVPAKQIVQMRIHGVNPQYVRELKALGLRPDASEVVEMRIHGVSPQFLKGLQEAGHTGVPVREIIQLRIHGVSPDFAKAATQLGYRFSVKELTDLRIHGVNEAYLRRLKDSGYRNLSAANIVRLRQHGID